MPSDNNSNLEAIIKRAGTYLELGIAAKNTGRVQEAFDAYERALELVNSHEHPAFIALIAKIHLNVGNLLLTTGDAGGAVTSYSRAIEIIRATPSTDARVIEELAFAHKSRANVCLKYGQLDTAWSDFSESIRIFRSFMGNNIHQSEEFMKLLAASAICAEQRGDGAAATPLYEEAIAIARTQTGAAAQVLGYLQTSLARAKQSSR